ncbi:MAG: metallophosphoesterase [Clostridia bacterium]|nr:metallophosphoesterase [Clostridia bacterium]
MKRGLATLFAFTICFSALHSCASKGDPDGGVTTSDEESFVSEPDDLTVLSDYVDFVVDVEAGRDIRVLQLTDVQTISTDQKRYPTRVTPSLPADTLNGYKKYIGQIIDRYDPDFIIMTGDNVYGEFDDGGERLIELIEFMDSFEIPWAPILGNHDAESFMGVDWQCEQYESSEYCLFKQRELTGNGNYSVALTQGGRLMRVFYMLDSNGVGNASKISLSNGHTTSTVGFGEDQIDWYTKSITAVKKKYPNVKLSMAFHIQIQAFSKAFRQYGYPLELPINLDKLDEAREKGDFGYIGSALKTPWDSDSTVWNSIKKLGVDSVFVGHEHTNSASIKLQGVRLTYGQKSSTFDRYNTDKNGPVMGGTYFDLSYKDGNIADSGLILYDQTLGYDGPVADAFNPDKVPEGATVTVLDFNGTDVDATVTTDTVKGLAVQDVTSLSTVPSGFDGVLYGGASNNASAIGIKLSKSVNAEKLLGMYVKMYVSDYSVASGKSPLIRIYNNKDNSILNAAQFNTLGGKTGEWVYIDILGLLKGSSGIVESGKINPFSLVYRFYGDTIGKIYFDSLTLVSDGDPFIFDSSASQSSATVRGETYHQYSASDFAKETAAFKNAGTAYYDIAKKSYSFKFTFTPKYFSGNFHVYGFTDKSDVTSGIGICLNNDGIAIDKYKTSYTFESGKSYEIETGFVSLHNGNTIYVFIKVDSQLVAWELVEAYGKTVGNVALVYDGTDGSVAIK